MHTRGGNPKIYLRPKTKPGNDKVYDGGAICFEKLMQLAAILRPTIKPFKKGTSLRHASFIDNKKSVAVTTTKDFEEKYTRKL